MQWNVRDIKYIYKKYKYRAKYRGHMYYPRCWVSLALAKRIKYKRVIMTLKRQWFDQVKELVKAGRDYPAIEK